ncbi:hypothetical protein HHK36_005009 [Tetracentron sinense]|uniref:Uncharacterized protein n=1 Tax=Tetracentron sinense TaxID=13715 RepID=A0A834ZKG6_TETSI|nr:hypothetical protein HHK36_005009 [Tetracentron sinense]
MASSSGTKSDMLPKSPSREMTKQPTTADNAVDSEIVPPALYPIVPILRVANEIQNVNPRVAYLSSLKEAVVGDLFKNGEGKMTRGLERGRGWKPSFDDSLLVYMGNVVLLSFWNVVVVPRECGESVLGAPQRTMREQ